MAFLRWLSSKLKVQVFVSHVQFSDLCWEGLGQEIDGIVY
jgi:hypothetical protein